MFMLEKLPLTLTILLADFNNPDGYLIFEAMAELGLQQQVHLPTSDNGATIDHVYVDQSLQNVATDVIDTYCSDHAATILLLNLELFH